MTGRRGLACPGYCWVHGHIHPMDPLRRDYRYRLENTPLPRMSWRWWIFEGDDQSHIDTGIVVSADRAVAEAAANDAIERRKQEAR